MKKQKPAGRIRRVPSSGNAFRDVGFTKTEARHLKVRADLLIAISLGRDESELRDFLTENRSDVINKLALAFAADKVEMGAIKAKLAQAELEIARSMSGDK